MTACMRRSERTKIFPRFFSEAIKAANKKNTKKIRKEMYEEIKSYGINLEEFKDIKKAYELIKEKYNL